MNHAIISHKTLVTILVLLATTNLQAAIDACFTHDYTVVINNWLPQESPDPLKLHCRSKNDDLGYHHELPYNQNFTWTFCESLIHNTLFTCDVGWGQAHQGFKALNSKDEGMCGGGLCYWQARGDGIYFKRIDYPDFYKKFDWIIGHA